jgi:hypothetical protein
MVKCQPATQTFSSFLCSPFLRIRVREQRKHSSTTRTRPKHPPTSIVVAAATNPGACADHYIILGQPTG